MHISFLIGCKSEMKTHDMILSIVCFLKKIPSFFFSTYIVRHKKLTLMKACDIELSNGNRYKLFGCVEPYILYTYPLKQRYKHLSFFKKKYLRKRLKL